MAKRKKTHQSGFNKNFVFRFLWKTLCWFLILSVLWVLVYRFINPPVTFLMVQKGIERKIAGESWKLEKEWRAYEDISNNLKKAAIAGEDSRFYQHHGFDLQALESAYERNKSGKNLRGGSTISQQTAKNVFLWPGRSYIRKGFEAYFTFLIELLWGKKRILEVYLNVIEMGNGIYGAEAATQAFYQQSCKRLSKAKAALLIAVLPNPIRWSPVNPTPYIYRRQSSIQRNMRRIKLIE